MKADQASVETARLNLEVLWVLYAPIDRYQPAASKPNRGAQIKSNDDKPMVTINQIQPIFVTFAVPEQNLNPIKKYADLGTLRVRASTNNGEAFQEEGQLAFIDNTVDPATGTIRLKGSVLRIRIKSSGRGNMSGLR